MDWHVNAASARPPGPHTTYTAPAPPPPAPPPAAGPRQAHHRRAGQRLTKVLHLSMHANRPCLTPASVVTTFPTQREGPPRRAPAKNLTATLGNAMPPLARAQLQLTSQSFSPNRRCPVRPGRYAKAYSTHSTGTLQHAIVVCVLPLLLLHPCLPFPNTHSARAPRGFRLPSTSPPSWCINDHSLTTPNASIHPNQLDLTSPTPSTQREGPTRLPPSKHITAELGNVTPYIVVPGGDVAWSQSDIEYHASTVATALAHNAGHNCIALEVGPDRGCAYIYVCTVDTSCFVCRPA